MYYFAKSHFASPNRLWYTTSMQRPLQIGILLERADESSRAKIGGIFRFAGEHPDWDMHVLSPVRPQVSRLRKMDGLIAGDAPLPPHITRSVPTVLIDETSPTRYPEVSLVTCDNASVGMAAAQLLFRCGYRTFAFVGTLAGTDAFHSAAREKAFRDRTASMGCPCTTWADKTFTVLDHRVDETRLADFLSGIPKPCGVTAYCDALAGTVIKLAVRCGMSVPDEIGILGVDDDTMITENSHPRISSIAIDVEGAGYRAAQFLYKRLSDCNSWPLSATYGITRIIERESTPVSIRMDRRVVKALSFINGHLHDAFGVADVADAIGVGVRTLELIFRKARRRTLHEEIIRMRLAEVRRMLQETDARITDIGFACGFGTSNNLKQLFRKRFGVSMREWRYQNRLGSDRRS